MLMSVTDIAKEHVVSAEDRNLLRRRQRVGPEPGDRTEVRAELASNIGIAPGTIENLRRGRVKDLRGSIRDKICAWMVASLRSEMARLEHDLQVALLISDRPDADAVIEAQTALAKARKLIEQRPV